MRILEALISRILLSKPSNFILSKFLRNNNVSGPSSRWGEEVAAFIQLKSGEEVGEEEIRDYCVDQISYYKVPSLFFFVQDYPTTASGKIQKYKLREQAIKELRRERDAREETV